MTGHAYRGVFPGRDAVDGVFATNYSEASLTRSEVWGYQVNSQEVFVGAPFGRCKRLDGELTVGFGWQFARKLFPLQAPTCGGFNLLGD